LPLYRKGNPDFELIAGFVCTTLSDGFLTRLSRMRPIYEYSDYRRFLQDYYAWAKESKRGFSHRAFLAKAGMSGPTYLKRVMEGVHDLTDNSIPKFAKALELGAPESEFFRSLVYFNQARTLEEKDRQFHRLMELKTPHTHTLLEKAQYEYYRDWHNIALREMLAILPYRENPGEFAKRLTPPVLPKKVKKAMDLLRHLGLVKQEADGSWRASTTFIHTDPGVESLLIPRFHQSMGRLAVDAVERVPKNERYFSGTTISVSTPTFRILIEKIRALRKEILDAVATDPAPERVFHLNMQLFPLTSGPRKRGRRKK
jgi:uncharacterized protein (TIGR02147 family)